MYHKNKKGSITSDIRKTYLYGLSFIHSFSKSYRTFYASEKEQVRTVSLEDRQLRQGYEMKQCMYRMDNKSANICYDNEVGKASIQINVVRNKKRSKKRTVTCKVHG